MLREESTCLISHKLSEPELRQRSLDLTDDLEQLEALKEEKKTKMAEYKERENQMVSRVKSARETVKTGISVLETPCVKVYDTDARQVWFELSDGSKHHKREMRDDEFGHAMKGDLFDGASEDEAM